ncbi:ornithine cyclodeaminase family protein [Nonomuraea phyllanthi]|nr:ornithine cyclodeaminase family protein [Nonomuraea phyllanthi]
MPFLDSHEVAARLPWPAVIDALDRAVPAAFGDGRFHDRSVIPARGGHLLAMPAASENAVGVKLVGVGPDNPRHGLPRIQALYVVFDARHLSPLAVLDGTSLTTIRTAGQSAAVVRRLAAPDARHLVVFGSGPQARAHVEALCAVRPVETVRIVARRPEPVAALCAELGSDRLDVRPGTPDDVSKADVVVCATTSATPVFDGRDLGERACVVAVGSHTPDARELDHAVFTRASLTLVEHRGTALREAGDIIHAVAAGVLTEDRITDFGDLAERGAPAVEGISVYKSVGMGYQDLAVIEEALRADVAGRR